MIALKAHPENDQTRVQNEKQKKRTNLEHNHESMMFISKNSNPWEICAAILCHENTPILLHFLELILMTILYCQRNNDENTCGRMQSESESTSNLNLFFIFLF